MSASSAWSPSGRPTSKPQFRSGSGAGSSGSTPPGRFGALWWAVAITAAAADEYLNDPFGSAFIKWELAPCKAAQGIEQENSADPFGSGEPTAHYSLYQHAPAGPPQQVSQEPDCGPFLPLIFTHKI